MNAEQVINCSFPYKLDNLKGTDREKERYIGWCLELDGLYSRFGRTSYINRLARVQKLEVLIDDYTKNEGFYNLPKPSLEVEATQLMASPFFTLDSRCVVSYTKQVDNTDMLNEFDVCDLDRIWENKELDLLMLSGNEGSKKDMSLTIGTEGQGEVIIARNGSITSRYYLAYIMKDQSGNFFIQEDNNAVHDVTVNGVRVPIKAEGQKVPLLIGSIVVFGSLDDENSIPFKIMVTPEDQHMVLVRGLMTENLMKELTSLSTSP